MGILPWYGIGYGLLQGTYPMPFVGRPYPIIAAHLIQAPIDLQTVVVGIAKLHRNLTSSSAPTFEIDGNVTGPQAITGMQDLIQRRDLEGHMVQLQILCLAFPYTHQGKAVVIRITPEKNHPTGHHVMRIDVGDLEAKDLGVEV